MRYIPYRVYASGFRGDALISAPRDKATGCAAARRPNPTTPAASRPGPRRRPNPTSPRRATPPPAPSEPEPLPSGPVARAPSEPGCTPPVRDGASPCGTGGPTSCGPLAGLSTSILILSEIRALAVAQSGGLGRFRAPPPIRRTREPGFTMIKVFFDKSVAGGPVSGIMAPSRTELHRGAPKAHARVRSARWPRVRSAPGTGTGRAPRRTEPHRGERKADARVRSARGIGFVWRRGSGSLGARRMCSGPGGRPARGRTETDETWTPGFARGSGLRTRTHPGATRNPGIERDIPPSSYRRMGRRF